MFRTVSRSEIRYSGTGREISSLRPGNLCDRLSLLRVLLMNKKVTSVTTTKFIERKWRETWGKVDLGVHIYIYYVQD